MNCMIYPRLRVGFIPWIFVSRRSSIDGTKKKIIIPWWELSIETDGERGSVHEDLRFICQFGWLTSRFRRRVWWAFGPLLFFEILRGIIHGGGSENSKAQVYGLLIIEIIYFIVLAYMMPFESTRFVVAPILTHSLFVSLLFYLFGIGSCVRQYVLHRLNVFTAYMLPIMRISTLAILCVVLATPRLNVSTHIYLCSQ